MRISGLTKMTLRQYSSKSMFREPLIVSYLELMN